MAFILLFLIGCLIMKTRDITWLIFLLVYGIDGCCTIVHRVMVYLIPNTVLAHWIYLVVVALVL